MARVAGTPDEVRGRVPAVLDAWEYMRDNVLHDGLVEPELLGQQHFERTLGCDAHAGLS